jgi:hypothetical protein
MLASTMLLWTGCMTSFLSSTHQQFLRKPLSPIIGWTVFFLAVINSWRLNSFNHEWLTAGLLVVVVVMLMWPVIILCHGHFKIRIVPFTMLGALTCIGFALLGEIHVG